MNTQKLVLTFAVLLLAESSTCLAQAIRTVGARDYQFSAGAWHELIDGTVRGRIAPHRIVVERRAGDESIPAVTREQVSVRFVSGPYVRFHVAGVDPFDFADSLAGTGQFADVEFAKVGRMHSLPDDPLLDDQGNLDSDIADGKRALQVSRGSGVRLAVIDVGVEISHPDLAPNMWINLGEDSDADGLILYQDASGNWILDPDDTGDSSDDDGNGRINDLIGWYVNASGNAGYDVEPVDLGSSSQPYHGTAVSGIAGARSNNGTGIAGIAGGWGDQASPESGVSLVPIRIDITSLGEIYSDDVCAAIQYARVIEAHVVNMSLGFFDSDSCISSAIGAAADSIVFVASSGNYFVSGENEDQQFVFPARHHHVVSVGAILSDFTVWDESGRPLNESENVLDLVAPGGEAWITTTDLLGASGLDTDDYGLFGGTSASAPHVAGTVALMRSAYPSLTAAQVRTLLLNSVDDSIIPPGADKEDGFGSGMLKIYDSVVAAILQKETDGTAIVIGEDPSDSVATLPSSILGKDVYVLEGAVAQISGTVTLDQDGSGVPSNLYVIGRLDGIGSNPVLRLRGGSELFKRSDDPDALDDTDLEIDGNGSCVYVSPGSELSIGSMTIQNNAFLAGAGTIKVADGATVTYTSGQNTQFLPGAKILLGEDAQFTFDPVNSLVVSNVIFAKSGSERWDKVALFGDDIALSDIDISGGDYGLYVQGTDIEVTRAKIYDNYYGIRSHYDYDQWGQNSELIVTDSEIYENDVYGMLLNYVDATIQENLIYDNGSYGVYASTAYLTDTWENEIYGNTRGLHYYNSTTDQDASFYRNYVHDNSQYGVYVSTNSTVHAFDGSSNISGNGSYEIYVGSSSGRFYPSLGPPVDISGFHDIYNTPGTGGYVIKHVVPGWVMPAADNYWGTSSPHSGMFSGGVTYTPYLSSSPATGPGGNYRILAAEDEVRASEWAPRAVAPTIKRNVAETNSAGDRKDDLKQSIVALRDELIASAGLYDVENEARIVQLYEYLLLDPTDETAERATSVAAIANLASDFVGADLQTRSGVDAVRRVGEAALVVRTMELLRSRDYEATLAVLPGYIGAAVSSQSVSELHALTAVAKEASGDLEGAIASLEAAELAASPDADVDFADQIAVLKESIELGANRSTPAAQAGLAPAKHNENATVPEPLSFTMYPNPAGEHAEFSAAGLNEGTLRLTVYDVTGRVVERRSYEVDASGRIRDSLSTGRWAAGLYFARIEAADGTSVNARLIKQ